MAAPGTGILSFGLVAIPIRPHTAIHDERIFFHLLQKKCGSRVRNQYVCPVCNVVVEREELVRGFEVSKDKYVQFTEEELESLETEANKSIDLDKLTAEDFKPEDSKDDCRVRVRKMLEEKASGKEIIAASAEPVRKQGQVIDLSRP